jgi:hypothetical protein
VRKARDNESCPALRADKFVVIGRGLEGLGLGVGALPHLPRSDAPLRPPERVVLVIDTGVGIGNGGVDIVERGQASPARLLQNEVALERLCAFDDAFDGLVPARWVYDGIIDCGDEIEFVRYGPTPGKTALWLYGAKQSTVLDRCPEKSSFVLVNSL